MKNNDIIENCGARLEIKNVAISLIEEWQKDDCEVEIITAQKNEIILEAKDEDHNKIQVKVFMKNGKPRMSVSQG